MLKVNSTLIRVKMAEKDINRRELAHSVGISELTLRRILRGENCQLSTLAKIAEVLEIRPEERIILNGKK